MKAILVAGGRGPASSASQRGWSLTAKDLSCKSCRVLGLGVTAKVRTSHGRRPRRSYKRTVRDRKRRHARNQRRRRRRRGWPLLIFGFLLCLLVANYVLWDSGRSAEATAIASVDRPTSCETTATSGTRTNPSRRGAAL